MFVDRVKVHVKAGKGGDGAVSFRKEKYVPKGGPDGGNGGDGGNVIVVANANLLTLLDLKYRPYIKATDGKSGGGKNSQGKRGEDVIIEVPVGTVVKDAVTGELVADLVKDGQQVVVARGGKGGRGNASFRSSTNQAPKWAEKGDIGEERYLELELKVVADVGIVGLPNAGKSTLLSRLSNAMPKVAAYPFTTLYPNIGVMQDIERSVVLADIPGLIEGAAEGRGLGIDFLRHIERARYLLLLLDVSSSDVQQIKKDYDTLRGELQSYGKGVDKKEYLVVGNKIDLLDLQVRKKVAGILNELTSATFMVSAITGEGVQELRSYLFKVVGKVREAEVSDEEVVERLTVRFEPDMIVEKDGQIFVVSGKKVLQMCRMTDFENEEAVSYFLGRLRRMGLKKRLHRLGAKFGDVVNIGGRDFLYEEVL